MQKQLLSSMLTIDCTNVKVKENIDNKVIFLLISRISTFKRVDCELMNEFIASQTNISIEMVSEIIENFITKNKIITTKYGNYFFTSTCIL